MSAPRFISDLAGTALSYLQVGLSGLRLKVASGKWRARNTADSADVEFVASQLSASGDSLLLNEDAAGSGADWTMKFSRPSSGMGEAREFIFPAGNPSVGQVLYVVSYAGGVATLDYTNAGAANGVLEDTTTIAFGDSSPVSMFTLPANAVVEYVKVIVDTAFNGTAPTVSIGIVGTTSKFMATTENDLKTTGIYEKSCADVATSGSTQAIIATYAADSSSAGSARVIVGYSIPS